jgi:D-lyxose ketol-isomerase
LIRESGIPITDKAMEKVEVADFGLSRLDTEGAQILTLIATDRITVKIIALFPSQTLPEHWHPRVGEDPGKEETVRVISGTVRFYIPGDESMSEGFVPDGKEDAYTVRHELILKPGEQITLQPGTKHWFQAGNEGAVMYSFSTVARDVLDCFTDPHIDRVTHIQE